MSDVLNKVILREGDNGFGKGKFKPGIHRRFTGLIGQQKAFLKAFESFATAEQRTFAESVLHGPVIDEVERLRDIAIKSPFTADLQGVTGPIWFAAITKKIDQMKQLEDYLAADLVALAEEDEVNAAFAFWSLAVALALAITVIFAIGWHMTRDVVSAIRDIVSAISKLAAGEDTEIKGSDRRDELGELSRSLETVYQKGLEAARLRSALDGCSTKMLVINRHAEIVYINPVMKQLLVTQKQVLSRLDVNKVEGSKIESLGLSEAEVMGSNGKRQGSYEIEMKLGDRRLRYVVNPVTNQAGTYLGTVLECSDLTLELTIQEEIDRVIQAVRQGDFDQAVDCKGIDGVYAKLADGVNQLTSVIGHAVDGRLRLVHHGHLPERTIQTGIGSVEVQQPRVRDRGSDGEKIRFSPAILPPYARRSRSLDALLPVLYLRGISSGDFQETLSALLGKDAPNLSPAVLGRLKAS